MEKLSNRAVWQSLARAAGIDPSRYRKARDWHKHTATQQHTVQLWDSDDGALFFKRLTKPSDPKVFQTLVEAQMRAAEAMSGGSEAVPEIIEFDAGERAVLMRAAPGETVYDLCRAGGDPAELLRRAGRWMAAFHRSGPVERRTFQPKFMRNHVAHLLRQHEDGDLVLANPEDFRRHAQRAIALGAQYENRETVSSVTHGDMNMRNILLDGANSWGIDFSASHSAPVGFDIARFLLHYMGVFGDLDAVPDAEVIDPALLAAFFEGYDLVSPDDPSVGYLLRIRILMDWVGIPTRMADRSMGQGRRLKRLGVLAERAFG